MEQFKTPPEPNSLFQSSMPVLTPVLRKGKRVHLRAVERRTQRAPDKHGPDSHTESLDCVMLSAGKVGQRDPISRRCNRSRPGNRNRDAAGRKLHGYAFPQPKSRSSPVGADNRQPFRQIVIHKVYPHVAHVAGLRVVARRGPALDGLLGGMIYFENPHVAQTGEPIGSPDVAGVQDHDSAKPGAQLRTSATVRNWFKTAMPRLTRKG